MEKLAKVYVKEIVRGHGVHLMIKLDRDGHFTSRFWKGLHEDMGTKVCFNTTYQLQTDHKSERTIQTLADMLWACTLEFMGN